MIDTGLITGVTGTLRTLVDGTVRVYFDFSGDEANKALLAYRTVGLPIVSGLFDPGVAQDNAANEMIAESKKKTKGPYGKQAQALWKSSFFRTPEVWRAIDTPKAYHEWVKTQPSALSGDFSYDSDPGIDQSKTQVCDPAHYRDSSECGVGMKPDYAEIPLTHPEHLAQTNSGYSAVGGKDWFAKKRIEYVQKWAWDTLKKELGYDSWSKANPEHLFQWCKFKGIKNYLPDEYQIIEDT